MRRGLLFTVSGPSGVGKGTICKQLMARMPELSLSISCTTRAPREGERDGREYFFIDEDRFAGMVQRDEFLEHAGVYGKHYGTPRAHVREMLDAGRDVILEIDMQGSQQVMQRMPETIGVFVLPPSFETLKARLIGRSTEKPEQLALRLSNARHEMSYVEKYDYIVLNDELEAAVTNLAAIIRAERARVVHNQALIDSIGQSFQEVLDHD